MKIVIDTNVLVSGLFFGGIPGRILNAWNEGLLDLVISAPILAEYREVGEELCADHPDLDFESFAALLVLNSDVVDAPDHLEPSVCSDVSDDKFLACAAAAQVKVVVSGDKQLRAVSGWGGIEVLTPRQFVERYL